MAKQQEMEAARREAIEKAKEFEDVRSEVWPPPHNTLPTPLTAWTSLAGFFRPPQAPLWAMARMGGNLL